MVGFEVTPTTWWVDISPARLPERSRSRLRSSNHTATPASLRDSSASLLMSLAPSSTGDVRPRHRVGPRRTSSRRGPYGSACGLGGALTHGRDDRLGGDPELLVQGLVRSRGTEVLQAHRHTGVADVLAPAQGHTGLDGDPSTHRGGQDLLAVALALGLEPLHTRHRDHTGGGAGLLE